MIPSQINGQILPNTHFCENIHLVISKYKPKNILEIGTWRGLGSTKCIIDAIIANYLDCNFISLESNDQFYAEAKHNLKNYLNYVNLLYGRIIEPTDILAYIQNKKILANNQWLLSDLNDIDKNNNVANMLPDKIDFCLFDGGEYSTYPEWILLKDKIHIIALDDTKTDKCNIIRQEIRQNINNYNILIDSDERNGFMIIENRNITKVSI
jgi:hypothetical protein